MSVRTVFAWLALAALVGVVGWAAWSAGARPQGQVAPPQPVARPGAPAKDAPLSRLDPDAPGKRCGTLDAAQIRRRGLAIARDERAKPDAAGVRRRGSYVIVPESVFAPLRDPTTRGATLVAASHGADVLGYRIAGLTTDHPAFHLGFRRNDIVGSVNGWSLDGMGAVSVAFEAVKDADVFCVDVMSDGRWRPRYVLVTPSS